MLKIFGFFMMILIGLELIESIKVYLVEETVHVEVILLVAELFALSTTPTTAAETTGQQARMDKARNTFESFIADQKMASLRNYVKDAKDLLIVPQWLKGGFVFSGSGGRGVQLVRGEETGQWSGPAFYSIGSVSWGVQIGVKVSKVIMMVVTQKGLESLYRSSIKLGGDVSVAAGPFGVHAEAVTKATEQR